MLNNYAEYQVMYQVEKDLWWYKILHQKVLNAIESKFNQNRDIKILDAGCGTGGLLEILKLNGYTNIQGFDFSIDAVTFCKERNLPVIQLDILKLENAFEANSFDLIINNDVLYQFENDQIKHIFTVFQNQLKPNGILISNNNAFNIFYGTHDIAVGGKQRFVINDFKQLVAHSNFTILQHTYWSFLLSPLILIVRLIQQLKLKFNLMDRKNIQSDLSLPNNLINNTLYKVVLTEQNIFKKCFFGSSLFITFQKTK